MPTELPKEFKHDVYKRALRNYTLRFIVLGCQPKTGLCYELHNAVIYFLLQEKWKHLNFTAMEITSYENMHLYPEIAKHKPDDKNMDGFWFWVGDIDKRIKILEQAINETKNEKEKEVPANQD